jgi:hypothetical protein
VVSATPGFSAVAVDGKLVVTGGPAPWNPMEGCIRGFSSTITPSPAGDGTMMTTTLEEVWCKGEIVYEVCSVAPGGCSQATLSITGRGSIVVEPGYDPNEWPDFFSELGDAMVPVDSYDFERLYGAAAVPDPGEPDDELGPAVPTNRKPTYTG